MLSSRAKSAKVAKQRNRTNGVQRHSMSETERIQKQKPTLPSSSQSSSSRSVANTSSGGRRRSRPQSTGGKGRPASPAAPEGGGGGHSPQTFDPFSVFGASGDAALSSAQASSASSHSSHVPVSGDWDFTPLTDAAAANIVGGGTQPSQAREGGGGVGYQVRHTDQLHTVCLVMCGQLITLHSTVSLFVRRAPVLT